jgi:DNA-binding response OmpR family regulator
MKILIAEDQPDTCHTLARSVTGWGYDVVSVGDGKQAWQALQDQESAQIALLDWVLPGMDGLEVCRRVRQCQRLDPIYVLLMSGRTSRDAIIAGLEGGADEYLPKPVDLDELRVRLLAGRRIVEAQLRIAARVCELEAILRGGAAAPPSGGKAR